MGKVYNNKRITKVVAPIILLAICAYTFIICQNVRPNNFLSKVDISSNIALEFETTKVKTSDIKNTNELMLVNEKYNIADNYITQTVSAYQIVQLSTSDIKINPVALDAVLNIFTDAKKQGYDKFFINSGYRSYAKQKELYNEAKDKSFVQKPNSSEHQTGLAMDIAYPRISGDTFDNSKQGKWLINNAPKYGLILRYPPNKTEITKISYEPWHFRYVGIPHAYFCFQNNITLEEYIDFLVNGGNYSVIIGTDHYTVYHTKETNGYIDVPEKGEYSISANNVNGYIITVKE